MRLLIVFAMLAGNAAADETQYQRHLRAYASASGDRTTIELLCETYGFPRHPVTGLGRLGLAQCVQREVKQLELLEALREAQDRELMYRSITQPIVPTR